MGSTQSSAGASRPASADRPHQSTARQSGVHGRCRFRQNEVIEFRPAAAWRCHDTMALSGPGNRVRCFGPCLTDSLNRVGQCKPGRCKNTVIAANRVPPVQFRPAGNQVRGQGGANALPERRRQTLAAPDLPQLRRKVVRIMADTRRFRDVPVEISADQLFGILPANCAYRCHCGAGFWSLEAYEDHWLSCDESKEE
jgi:hypothetical protein